MNFEREETLEQMRERHAMELQIGEEPGIKDPRIAFCAMMDRHGREIRELEIKLRGGPKVRDYGPKPAPKPEPLPVRGIGRLEAIATIDRALDSAGEHPRWPVRVTLPGVVAERQGLIEEYRRAGVLLLLSTTTAGRTLTAYTVAEVRPLKGAE